MYDATLVELADGDPRILVAELRACDRELRLLEGRKLALAARFADCYGYIPDTFGPSGERLKETYPGCPAVAEFASCELGAALGVPEDRAWQLIEDAVGLRHRFPLLWAAVLSGDVWGWQARQVVTRTGMLSREQCQSLDDEITAAFPRVAFARVLRLLAGRVAELTAPPPPAQRFAKVVVHDADGADLWAKLNPADARRLDRTLSELARVFRDGGDTRGLDERRAAALGVLACPARALQYQVASLLDEAAASATCAGADDRSPWEAQSMADQRTAWEALPAIARPEAVSPDDGWGSLAAQVAVIDPEQLRPRSELHIHFTPQTLAAWSAGSDAGVARCEELGPVLRRQLIELLGHDQVTVRPLVIPLELEPQDAYEARPTLQNSLRTLHPYETFPFGREHSRRCDLDHADPYRRGGPPGQTNLRNLHPLSRKAHRAKTFGGWKVAPDPDHPLAWRWTSPLGYHYAVDPLGARCLGAPSSGERSLIIAAAS